MSIIVDNIQKLLVVVSFREEYLRVPRWFRYWLPASWAVLLPIEIISQAKGGQRQTGTTDWSERYSFAGQMRSTPWVEKTRAASSLRSTLELPTGLLNRHKQPIT